MDFIFDILCFYIIIYWYLGAIAPKLFFKEKKDEEDV